MGLGTIYIYSLERGWQAFIDIGTRVFISCASKVEAYLPLCAYEHVCACMVCMYVLIYMYV